MSVTPIKEIKSGYNVSKINDNFSNLQSKVDNDLISSKNGQNVLYQDLDVNSNNLLNVNVLNVQGLTIAGSAVTISNLGSLSPNSVGTAQVVNGSITDPKIVSVNSTKAFYQQAGVGALVRSVQDKLRDGISVKDFGALGNGVTDDTSAIAAAITYAASLGTTACVYFPRGTYPVSSPLTLPPKVSLRGEDMYSTVILATVNNLIIFSCINSSATFANFSVSNLSLATNNTGVVGLKYVYCYRTVMYNVAFLGLAQNFNIDRGQYHLISNCLTSGFNLRACGTARIWSSTDSTTDGYCTAVLLTNYHIENVGTGTDSTYDPAAIYCRRAVSFIGDHIYAFDLGISNTGPAQAAQNGIIFENDCQGCKVSDSIFVHPNQGVILQQGAGVAVVPTFTTISHVDVDQATSNSLNVNQALYTSVVGGSYTPNASTTTTQPIVVNSGASHTSFDSVMVFGFNGLNGSGFYINGAGYVTISNCQIDTCYYGIVLNGASHTKLFGNTFSNCTNKLNGTFTGIGNNYSKNDGFNPLAVSTPPFPATGVPVTNNTGTRCSVYTAGGTITSYNQNGVNLSGITGPTVLDLEPGDTITIAYTGSPVWSWVGH